MARIVRSLSSFLGSALCVALAIVSSDVAKAFAQNPPAAAPGQPAAQGRGGGGGRGRGGIRIMTLTSSAFQDGGVIPLKYAQPGHDVSPGLSWSDAPDSTASFVLMVHDVDAAIGDGTGDTLHWMVWGIPGSIMSLPEGVPQGPTIALSSAVTPPAGGRGGGGGGGMRQLSVSGPYYRGPAAPPTGPAHHYLFELYALDANINVQAAGQQTLPTREAVVDAMKTHIRGKAVLVGLFRRAAP